MLSEIFEMPVEYRSPEFIDQWGDPKPPWRAFPEIERYSIGWRMGDGEWYMTNWCKWYDSISIEHRRCYRSKYWPPLLTWWDFYLLNMRNKRLVNLMMPFFFVWFCISMPLHVFLYPIRRILRIQL